MSDLIIAKKVLRELPTSKKDQLAYLNNIIKGVRFQERSTSIALIDFLKGKYLRTNILNWNKVNEAPLKEYNSLTDHFHQFRAMLLPEKRQCESEQVD